MANENKIIAQVGTAGAVVGVAGASAVATSAATIIVATGGAAAVALIGYGFYKWISSK